jgi:spectrin beta
MDVEDLLQKHALLASDLNIIAEQIQVVNRQAEPFMQDTGPDGTGYKPVDPSIVRERVAILDEKYRDLLELAELRKRRLEDNKRLCQFWWDLADVENHLREQAQVLSLGDTGRDITSVNRLLAKHRNAENNLSDLKRRLDSLDEQGRDLMQEKISGSEAIPARIAKTHDYYNTLKKLADDRRKQLDGAVEYFQFFHHADDVEAYLLDTLRVVSSDDVGRDESSVNALLKKHDSVSDELERFDRHIEQLHAQVQALPEEARAHPDIVGRLEAVPKRKRELEEISRLRKQRLIDALSLYKLIADVDTVEAWVDEKV